MHPLPSSRFSFFDGTGGRGFCAGAVGLLLAASAVAQSLAPGANPNPSASATVPRPASAASAGNAKVGQGIAQNGLPPGVAACATCHGAQGEGNEAFPPLAGNGAAYLQAQLNAFADGSRAQPIMQGIAKGLSAQQRADVAAFYAGQVRASPIGSVPAPSPDDAGAWLAERGRWSDGIPACAQCHGPDGLGVGEHFPALAGLSAAYMQAQMAAWQQGTRPPGPLHLMGPLAKKLSAQDAAAVADYYARLHAAPAPAPAAGAAPSSRPAAAAAPAAASNRPGAARAAQTGGSKP